MKRILLCLLFAITIQSSFAQVNQSRSICSGGTVNLVASDFGLPDTTTFTWNYSVTAGSVSGTSSANIALKNFNQNLFVSGNAIGVVVYSVVPTYGNPFNIIVNVNPTSMFVDASAISPTICSGSNFYAGVSGVPANTQYTWTVPIMSTGVSAGVAQSTPQPYIVQSLSYTGAASTSGTATYIVTPSVGGCVNPSFTFTVTVGPTGGTAPVISNSGTIVPKCSGGTVNFSATASPSSGVSFTWVRPSQYGISQSYNSGTNNAINEVLNDTLNTPVSAYYFYNLTYGTGGKCLTTQVVSVSINPVALITPKQVSVCSGSTMTVNINDIIPANTRYTWTTPTVSSGTVTGAAAASQVSLITQTLTNNPITKTVPVTLNYIVTPTAITGAYSCPSPTFPVTVTLNPVSTTTQQTTAVCSNQPFNLPLTAFPPGTNFTWSLAPTIAPTTSAITGGTNQTTPTNVISQTLVNNTNQAATATFVITPTTGNCVGSIFNAIVTVNPVPNISNLNQAITVCSGSALIIPQSGVPINTNYTWSMPMVNPSNALTGTSAMNAQTSFTQTITNQTINPVTATYLITPNAGSCSGAQFTMVVTVNPVATYSTQSYSSCSGINFTFNPYNAPSGTTYTWNLPNYSQNAKLTGGNSQSLPQNSISQNLMNNADYTSIATYTITPNTNGCQGPDFNLIVTVNPLPLVPDVIEASCSGTPFNIIPKSSIAGTLYTWSAPEIPANNLSGGLSKTTPVPSITGTLINATTANAIAKYIVTPIANGCVGNTFNVVETINPVPTVSLLTQKICSNTSFDASPTGLPTNALTLYTWNAPVMSPAGALIGGSKQDSSVTNISQNLINNTTSVATASYNVTPSTGGCIGNPFKVVITVTPRASISDLNTTICSGGTFITVPGNVPTGTKYAWGIPNVSTGILGGTANALYVDTISQTLINSNTNVSYGLATYSVTPITDGCSGANFNLVVNVNSSNATLSSALNAPAICSNTILNYTPTSNIDGTAFIWTRDTVAGIDNPSRYGYGDINETLINNTSFPITVKYYFTLSSNGCTNLNKQTVFVVVNPIPKLSSSANPSAICSGSTFNYSATSNSINVLFEWSRSYLTGINEGVTAGSGNISEVLTNKTTNVLLVPYIYTLTANGCNNTETVFLSVNPVISSPDISVSACSGADMNITVNGFPQNTLYTWSFISNTGGVSGSSSQTFIPQSSINQKLFNNTNAVGNAVYQVTPSLPSALTSGCNGKPFNLTVLVNPLPVLTSSAVATPVCSNTEFNYTPTSNIAGTSFSWYRASVTGIQNAKSSGLGLIKETLIDSTINAVNVLYKFVLSARGCNDTTYSLKVLVNPSPVLSDKSITICSGTTFVLPPDLMPINTTYKWGAPITIPSSSLTGYSAATSAKTLVSDSLYNNTLNNATAIYNIQPINNICSIAPFNLLVNTVPIPVITDQEISYCSGAEFIFMPNKIPTNTYFQWQNPLSLPYGIVTGYTADTLLHNNIHQKLVNHSVSNAKAVYTITPSNSGCAGNNFKLTVNVYATPTLSINALKSVCQNQVDTFYLNLLGNAPWNLTYLDNVTGLPATLKNVTNPTQKIIQYNLPDTTVYNFKLINIQDANCYNDTSTISFTQQILPLPHDSIYTPAGNQICINQSLPLSVNNTKATLYQWFFKDSLIVQTNTNTIQASLPGVYFAATKNTFGCINKTVNTVTMKQLFNNPTIDFTNDVACNLLPIRFSNQTDTLSTGHLNWVWQFSDTDSLNGYNATYTYKTGGTKHIKLIAKSTICNYNVIKDTSLLIRIPETGMMLPPATTYMNTNFRLHSRNLIGDTYKYKWEPSWGLDSTNIASPNFNFNLNQVYKISYISAHGCITTDTIPVYVFENTVVDLFVPKSFSPNGDGVNDQLFVYLAGIKNFHYLKIYNKFGQLIFENKSSDIPWDGTSNGVVQPLGAYAWIAEGEDVNGKIQTKTGSVMLLR